MHKADITTMLGQMCAAHLLEASGHGRGTKYHIYGRNYEFMNANVEPQSTNVALPGSNDALSDSNVALPDSNVALPKRYSKEQLREIIKEVCQDWVTVEVISARIDRNVTYVKNHILPQLSVIIEKM